MKFISIQQIKVASAVTRMAILLIAILIVSPSSKNVLAQTKNLQIVAESIDSKKLPFPGKTIKLRAEVNNTRDFRLPVRLLAVSDGKFHEIAAQPGLLGSNDRPQYSVEVPAPLAELIYQFVLILPNGSALSSQRVSVRRDCIPNVEPAKGKLGEDINGIDKFNVLLTENKRLENEIDNLEKAISEIDALTELMSQ